MLKNKIGPLLFAMVIIFAYSIVSGSQWSPWEDSPKPAMSEATKKPIGYFTNTSMLAIRLYQKLFSEVIGNRCLMWPSCSHYSLEAFAKHGFLLGIAMTADRLIHEVEEQKSAPFIYTPYGLRYSDPLQANDFWLKDKNDLQD
jgi:putative membrane protein insertion efficiency factor